MKNTKIYDIYYRRFPYPFRFGSYHAILRSLTIAKLVERLYHDSKLATQTYERLLRTRRLIRILIYYELDSVEVNQAIDTINKVHMNVEADNEDYLYVLSTFFLEPLRWNAEFGSHLMKENDIRWVIDFWCKIGEKMDINDIPVELDQWLEFQKKYEDKYMAYSKAGHQLAISSINEICRQAIPVGLRSLAKQLVLGTLDDKVRNCLKLQKPILPTRLMLKGIEKLQLNFEPKRDIVDDPAALYK